MLWILVSFSNYSFETGSLKAGVTPPNIPRVSAQDNKQRCPNAGPARLPGGQTESGSPGAGLGMVSVGVTVCGVTAKFKKLRVSVKHSGQDLIRIPLRTVPGTEGPRPLPHGASLEQRLPGMETRSARPSGEDSVGVPRWPSPPNVRF